jgi:hypothetical protein
MSESSSEANEADVAEQQADVDPDLASVVGPELSPLEANEADVAEQSRIEPGGGDEDYPRADDAAEE